MPHEIDVVERLMRQLEIEKMALEKETDAASKERLEDLEQELANLQEQATDMKAHWQSEKEAIAAIFFRAEDGIRAGTVTGVQTCALPISPGATARVAACAVAASTSGLAGCCRGPCAGRRTSSCWWCFGAATTCSPRAPISRRPGSPQQIGRASCRQGV